MNGLNPTNIVDKKIKYCDIFNFRPTLLLTTLRKNELIRSDKYNINKYNNNIIRFLVVVSSKIDQKTKNSLIFIFRFSAVLFDLKKGHLAILKKTVISK